MVQTFVVTGATGLVGRALSRQLLERGDQVVVLSRNPEQARSQVPGASDYRAWGPTSVPQEVLEGADGVIHLAGAPVLGERWSKSYKEQILTSRTEGTRALVDAMARCTAPPRVLVSASAIGYYGFRDDTALRETAPAGSDFLAQVCVRWETEANRAQTLGIRTVILRFGIILDAETGALAKMLPPFRNFVGGPLGSGRQWFSWVHRDDVVGAICYALASPTLKGTYNCTAPEPLTMVEFSQVLGQTLSRPSWAAVPRLALEVLLGEGAVILVEGQRVLPTKLEQAGYRFRYPTAAQALRDLLGEG
ncbi:TIGR01777 family oxidoreductase [Anthocerotibacter panamensis]|uniref:TIGR01777 family oxidoreductase n=1 Tax=Anthocerotibacter panamensis TaxID=2857077 RepID=UPI001C405C64|nr:TIGR01777 family oxidoreductase [Anthocerotibacter panamensis]